jgi:uncharacterized membrane protein
MAREYTEENGVRCVEKTLTVRRPPIALYQAWRNLGQLPGFMHNVVSVSEVGTKSHWVVTAPGGTMEWDAEIVADIPGVIIAWRSLEDADVRNSGEVTFRRAPQGRATEVRVRLRYEPPGGALGDKVASLAGAHPAEQLDADMLRFKQLMETGLVPSTEGQSRGTGVAADSDEQAADDEGVAVTGSREVYSRMSHGEAHP